MTQIIGRFRIEAYPRPQDGEVMVMTTAHANGSFELGKEIRLRKDDLHDLRYAVEWMLRQFPTGESHEG